MFTSKRYYGAYFLWPHFCIFPCFPLKVLTHETNNPEKREKLWGKHKKTIFLFPRWGSTYFVTTFFLLFVRREIFFQAASSFSKMMGNTCGSCTCAYCEHYEYSNEMGNKPPKKTISAPIRPYFILFLEKQSNMTEEKKKEKKHEKKLFVKNIFLWMHTRAWNFVANVFFIWCYLFICELNFFILCQFCFSFFFATLLFDFVNGVCREMTKFLKKAAGNRKVFFAEKKKVKKKLCPRKNYTVARWNVKWIH